MNHSINTFPTPILTVDVVLFTIKGNCLQVYLMKRPLTQETYPGQYALPGGFVHPQEDADMEQTARRVIAQKVGISHDFYLEQLQTFSGSKRDPRGWSVSQTFCGVIPADVAVQEGWFPVTEVLEMDLAFDHAAILAVAMSRVRNKTNYSLLPMYFLPNEFTLTELQRVYEVVLGAPLEKSAFRKKIDALDAFNLLPYKKQEGRMRPAQLYTRKLKTEQLNFFRRNLS
jgi:ADP-ribose pyrophosphatase YjhB (NUDIX family)